MKRFVMFIALVSAFVVPATAAAETRTVVNVEKYVSGSYQHKQIKTNVNEAMKMAGRCAVEAGANRVADRARFGIVPIGAIWKPAEWLVGRLWSPPCEVAKELVYVASAMSYDWVKDRASKYRIKVVYDNAWYKPGKCHWTSYVNGRKLLELHLASAGTDKCRDFKVKA